MAFFRYAYNADTVANMQANVLADVVAIVTGTTNVNSLSSGCNKADTLIISDVAAGWTLHDNAAGTNAKCVKAQFADDPTAFKYVVLDTNSAGEMTLKLYSSWDATAHTGKNLANLSNSTSTAQLVQNVANSVGGWMFGWVTARYLILFSRVSAWGSPSYFGPTCVVERSRGWPLDTVALGIPPVLHFDGGFMLNGSGLAYAPMKQTRTGIVTTGTSAAFSLLIGPWGASNLLASNLRGQNKKAINASGQSFVPIYPVFVADMAESGLPYGSLTEACGIYAAPGGILGMLETVTINGNSYSNIPLGSADNLSLLIRKG
jgi:hypothetical protein